MVLTTICSESSQSCIRDHHPATLNASHHPVALLQGLTESIEDKLQGDSSYKTYCAARENFQRFCSFKQTPPDWKEALLVLAFIIIIGTINVIMKLQGGKMAFKSR